jgi:uncharacterized membrane protein
MKRLANYFFQGLIYLLPIAGTVWLFVATFTFIDGLLGLPVPGVGVLVLVVLVTLFGFLLSNYLAAQLFALFEQILDKLPFAKLLHMSMKDLMSAFVGEERRFKQPVAVELVPGSGVRVFGFITRPSMSEMGFADDVGVYFPQAYNFAGQLVMVPRERITLIERDSAEVMAFIVSGGVSTGHTKTDMKAVKG